MQKPTLPPQAYTREMLSQAYAWVQSQPESIKRMATNSDSLVGLYLRHQRHGDLGFATPAAGAVTRVPIEDTPPAPSSSSIAFKNELRHLAEDMRQFEGDLFQQNQQPQPAPQVSATSVPNSISINLLNLQQQPQQQAPAQHPVQQQLPLQQQPPPPPSHIYAQQNEYATAAVAAAVAAAAANNLLSQLDAKSQRTVHDVKILLNLSSDSEALRVLISLGYEKLKPLIDSKS